MWYNKPIFNINYDCTLKNHFSFIFIDKQEDNNIRLDICNTACEMMPLNKFQ